jgi:hypothetical protein
MRVLALDLGRHMGVADGDSYRNIPGVKSETVTLLGDTIEHRVNCLTDWLDRRLTFSKPELIVTEAPMNPAASKSDRATIDQLAYYFCLVTCAWKAAIHVEPAPVRKIRKHFVGVAGLPRIKGRKRTTAEAAAARAWINNAVLRRAILLGYLPEGSRELDRANACAIFDFGCATIAARSVVSASLIKFK